MSVSNSTLTTGFKPIPARLGSGIVITASVNKLISQPALVAVKIHLPDTFALLLAVSRDSQTIDFAAGSQMYSQA